MDPSKKELYSTKRTNNLDTSEPQILNIWNDIKNEKPQLKWMFTKIENSKLIVSSYGNESISDAIESLDDNDIYYGILRCKLRGKVKFYHVYVVGKCVNGMKKGKGSLFKNTVFNLFEAHGEISFPNGIEEFTSSSTLEKIAEVAKIAVSDVII